MAYKFPDKDPNDLLDHMFDWGSADEPFLAPGEEIVAATVTVAPTGELAVTSTSNTTSTVTFRLGSGVVGNKYTITCQITTSTGNIANRKATISVKDL